MSIFGAESPETSGSLVQSQRRRSMSIQSMNFPAWVIGAAERNEHRLGGMLFVVGVASIVWGAVAIGLAAVILVL